MVPPAPRPLHGLTVLVIADRRDTVDRLSKYLAAYGATVLGAGTAKAALAFTETHVVDVALVDMRMLAEDISWFLRELRVSRTPSAHAPVFAIGSQRDDRPDPGSGFAGYFMKPIELVALITTLSALPGEREAVA